MDDGIGHRVWAIPEGYIPGDSTGPADMESHEALCFLNTSSRDAQVELTIYFSDREPAGPYRLEVPARRTLHQWLNKLDDPGEIPKDTDYAMVVRSDVPIVVQHTRLDSRQAENALLSTMAFPVPN
ncbi:MAG TPA: sensory rhodopsin transducer [Longimicrobiales bacterium]|nr:sensory rhodopsin transducer [Longimicrobiales bacterium]